MSWAPRWRLFSRRNASVSATCSPPPPVRSALSTPTDARTIDGDQQALRRLGLVASAYLVLLAAIATLAPFELAWPERLELDFGVRRDDLALNLLMLLPLGFVSGLGAAGHDRTGRRGLLLGAGLSLTFELLQLLLPVRYANPFDLAANAAGAWAGAWLYASRRSWIDARLLSVLRARPPLAALPIALLPALWLDGLALYTPARGLLSVLLGIAGASAAAATWRAHVRGPSLPARVGLWYAIGAAPALLVSPASRVAMVAFGLACSVAAARFLSDPPDAAGPDAAHAHDRQRLALARCLPWLGAYLLAVAVWSPPLRNAPQWTLGFVPFTGSAARTMLAFLEYLAAFTLLGYLHALVIPPATAGTCGRAQYGRFARVALHACVLGCALELLRAVAFGRCGSGTAVALLVTAAVSGACLHDAQRAVATGVEPEPQPARARSIAA